MCSPKATKARLVPGPRPAAGQTVMVLVLQHQWDQWPSVGREPGRVKSEVSSDSDIFTSVEKRSIGFTISFHNHG